MDYSELIEKRQSCRNFDKTKEVAKADIEKILQNAMLAPSACNSQPWKFAVATGEKASEIASATQSMGMNKFTASVPVFIIISEGAYNKTALVGSKIKDQDYKSVDIGLATSQLCISATEIGLSTCILGWFDEKKVAKISGVNSRIRLIIALGYASEGEKHRNKIRKDFSEVVTFIE